MLHRHSLIPHTAVHPLSGDRAGLLVLDDPVDGALLLIERVVRVLVLWLPKSRLRPLPLLRNLQSYTARLLVRALSGGVLLGGASVAALVVRVSVQDI